MKWKSQWNSLQEAARSILQGKNSILETELATRRLEAEIALERARAAHADRSVLTQIDSAGGLTPLAAEQIAARVKIAEHLKDSNLSAPQIVVQQGNQAEGHRPHWHTACYFQQVAQSLRPTTVE